VLTLKRVLHLDAEAFATQPIADFGNCHRLEWLGGVHDSEVGPAHREWHKNDDQLGNPEGDIWEA